MLHVEAACLWKLLTGCHDQFRLWWGESDSVGARVKVDGFSFVAYNFRWYLLFLSELVVLPGLIGARAWAKL